MAYQPQINARVNVTARDLANGNILKRFLTLHDLNFDFDKGMVNVVDATGSFFFPLKPVTTVTFTVVTGINGQYSIVIS